MINSVNNLNIKTDKMLEKEDEESDVVFAGRLIKDKNVEFFNKSCKIIKKRNPDIKCIVVGDGPEREKLEKLVKDILVLTKDSNIFKK